MATSGNKKLEDFVEAYGELVKKHGVDFVAVPHFVPGEDGTFKVICRNTPIDMDELNRVKASDFIPSK